MMIGGGGGPDPAILAESNAIDQCNPAHPGFCLSAEVLSDEAIARPLDAATMVSGMGSGERCRVVMTSSRAIGRSSGLLMTRMLVYERMSIVQFLSTMRHNCDELRCSSTYFLL